VGLDGKPGRNRLGMDHVTSHGTIGTRPIQSSFDNILACIAGKDLTWSGVFDLAVWA